MLDIFKAVVKTGTGTAATLLFGIINTKIVAVFLGPAGLGLLSILRQARQTISIIAYVNGTEALVQGAARKQGEEKTKYLVSVFWIILIVASVVCILILFFSKNLSQLFFNRVTEEHIALIRLLIIPILLSVAFMFYTSILNVHRAIGRLALANAVGALIGALIAYPFSVLIDNGYYSGYIWMLGLSTFSGMTLAIYFCIKNGWNLSVRDLLKYGISSIEAKHFLKIAITTLATGTFFYVTVLIIRATIVRIDGLHGAGIFDAVWTLSMMYVTLILNSFITYYLPSLSGISDKNERDELMHKVMRLVILIVIPLVVTAIAIKPIIIKILYSEEFMPSLETVRWMLIGDYFKIISFVLSVTMIAYSDMKSYFIVESSWAALFLSGSLISLLSFKSQEGIGITFLATYILYFLFNYMYVRSRFNHRFEIRSVISIIIGVVIISIVSILTWNDRNVNWLFSICAIAASFVTIFFLVKKSEINGLKRIFFSR